MTEKNKEEKNKEEKNKKKGKRISFLILLLLLMILCALLYLIRAQAPGDLVPNHAPRQTEKNAVEIDDEKDTEKMEAEEGGGAVSITYSMEVEVNLEESIAKLHFANPRKSTANMILQIMIQDQVIAQSDLLLTGRQVGVLELKKNAAKHLMAGEYDGIIRASFYDAETGEKANVNTEIPVTIRVYE